MSKYLLEIRCKHCGFKRDTTHEELDSFRPAPKSPMIFPECCGERMRLHPYRPDRYERCDNASCQFAEGGVCGCTCEGTFHGAESGRTQKARYLYA